LELSTWPTMNFESSQARNSAAAAMSRGSPKRPIGVIPSICLRTSLGIGAVIGVSMNPGAMQLTRIPIGTTSRATDLVNEMIAPFAAQ